MRLLVVSDTHGDSLGLSRVLGLLGASMHGLIHCGDGCTDIQAAQLASGRRLPVYAVRGNVDASMQQPLIRGVHIEDRKLLVAHGHHFLHGNSNALLLSEARRQGACAFLFGHTHVPFIKMVNNILLLNPGSLSRPRSVWGPSFAIIDVPQRRGSWIDVKFYELTGTRSQPRLHAFRP